MENTSPHYTQYKVEIVSEGALGTLFLGSSAIPVEKLEARLNIMARQGWEHVFQVLEKKRFLLFWTRETVIVTFGKR